MSNYSSDTIVVFIVDQQGATYVFLDRTDAEKFLVSEAWRGAVHLTIGQAEAPSYLADDMDTLADWAVRYAPDCGCDA